MIVNIVDAFLILFLLLGAVVGYKNGAVKEGMQFIGMLVIVIIAFLLKDKLMVVLYENLPFFDFFGFIKGISAINILFYQVISFLIIFAALSFILKVLIVVTGFVEWMLKLTVFLRVPSKIFGIVIGVLEFYVYTFLIFYVLNMPVFNLSFIADSKYGNLVLNNTPILSSMADDTVKAYSDVWEIMKNRGNLDNKTLNTLILNSLIDNKLVTVSSAQRLVESNKIMVNDGVTFTE